ncbi:ubiquinone biosynthesis O-methyltransferase [Apiospora saccharicola]
MVARPSTALLLRRLRGLTPALRRRPESFVTSRYTTSFLDNRSCCRSFSSTGSGSPSDNAHQSTSDPNFTTVSPDEVSHFNALASSWWDPHGPSRILHLMNPLRHDFIRMCRNSVLDAPSNTGLTYLDIGCGGGIFAESAARLPGTKSVTAIDPSPEVLNIARGHARRDPSLRYKLQYLNTPIEQLTKTLHSQQPQAAQQQPQQPQYDVVSVFEVLEHVSNPAQFLDQCAPFVKPGGWLVMSTIARTWLSWFTTNLMAEDVLRIVPRGTHDWQKYVNEEELQSHFMAGRSGQWAEPRCMGVIYIPGVGWREVLGSEKVGNYFFAVRKTAEE